MRRLKFVLLTGLVAALVPAGSARAQISDTDDQGSLSAEVRALCDLAAGGDAEGRRSLRAVRDRDRPVRRLARAGGTVAVDRRKADDGSADGFDGRQQRLPDCFRQRRPRREYRTGACPARQPAGADGNRFEPGRRPRGSSISWSREGGSGSTSTRPRPSGRRWRSARGCWRWPSGSTSDRAAAVMRANALTLALASGPARQFRDCASDPGQRHRCELSVQRGLYEGPGASRPKAWPTCSPPRPAPQSTSTIRQRRSRPPTPTGSTSRSD